MIIENSGLLLVLLVLAGLNSTNTTEILEYVENHIIKGLDDGYCPPDYYGGDDTGLYDLLDRGWCQ
jgi:hypothetical protein